jgi:hypothetical protein
MPIGNVHLISRSRFNHYSRTLPFAAFNAGITMADHCANLVRIDDLNTPLKVVAEPGA